LTFDRKKITGAKHVGKRRRTEGRVVVQDVPQYNR